jgi:hypothetical protein
MTTMSAAADGGRGGEKKYGMVSCAPKGDKWLPSGSISLDNSSRYARDFLVVAMSFLRVRPCPAQVCFGVVFVLGK